MTEQWPPFKSGDKVRRIGRSYPSEGMIYGHVYTVDVADWQNFSVKEIKRPQPDYGYAGFEKVES